MAFNETVGEALTAAALAGRVRRRRLARAPDTADRAPAPAREPAARAATAMRRCARPIACAISWTACSRSRGRTRGAEASARVDASALMRERVETWLPLAEEHGVGSRRASSTARCRCAPRRDGSPRCSTTSSPTHSRRRPPVGRSLCRLATSVAVGGAARLATRAPGSPRSSGSGRSTASGAPDPATGGSGLGLAIVQAARRGRRGRGRAPRGVGRRRRRRGPPASWLSLYRNLPARSPAVCPRSRRTQA